MNDLVLTQGGKSLAILDQDLHSALEEFLRLNVADGSASPRTIETIYSHLKMFSQWCETEGIEPTRASEDDIKALRASMVEDGYKPSTIHGRLVSIRKLFDAAIWRGFRTDNPAKGVKAPKDKADPADKVKFLPFEGFKRLLNAPDTRFTIGRRDRAILALLGIHGLRVFEVAQLPLDSLTDDTLTINGKGDRERKVYLTPESGTVLAAWLMDRRSIRTGAKTVFIALGNNNYGGPMTTRGIRHLVDGYLIQCSLKGEGISCHSLRHSFATWATFRGAKIEHLQAAMGHSKRETTAIYQGVMDRVKNNPSLLLGELLTEDE